MSEEILDLGRRAGFAAVESHHEKIFSSRFEAVVNGPVIGHQVSTDRVSVRAFWEQGEPVGFCLSNPGTDQVKRAFAQVSGFRATGLKENWAHLLPGSARKIDIDLFDLGQDRVDQKIFLHILDRVQAAVKLFPGLGLGRVQMSREWKKVYLQNTNGLDIKYRKTRFSLTIGISLQENRLDIVEKGLFFNGIDPEKMVTRGSNLLGSLTGDKTQLEREVFLVMAPEASAFILQEFSPAFRIDGQGEKIDFPFPARINLVDDPCLKGQVGSVPFDDEGIQGRERYLIRKGILRDKISSIETAFDHGVTSSGNGFCTSRSIFPAVRFSNLYIKPTVLSQGQLMKAAGEGILVCLVKLKGSGQGKRLFSAYGYRFTGEELKEPVHFYIETAFAAYFLNILKISSKLRFCPGTYNIGSPHLLFKATRKSPSRLQI